MKYNIANVWSSHVATTATFSALSTHRTPATHGHRGRRHRAARPTDAPAHFQALIFLLAQVALTSAARNATIDDFLFSTNPQKSAYQKLFFYHSVSSPRFFIVIFD
jgi:hypothetical protein